MNIKDITYSHDSYTNILSSRGMKGVDKNMPLWKLKLTDEEYENLKKDLRLHLYELNNYGIEAALCYAEWWRRDYRGNIPSKEDVANSLGINNSFARDLFEAAYKALKKRGYTFIRSQKGTEYFRTLLNQGGIPVNYIKSRDGGLSNFSRFLKGLVRELSIINYDWNDKDNSIIQQFNCISYLAKSFKNDNIYDISMQIAHAIIMDDTNLLPYDDTDESFSKLTQSLKNEYSRAKSERHVKPLSLHWKLRTTDNAQGYLFVNMDVVKDISSSSIPGLNISTCYSFDVFVAGNLVGKYVRKSVNKNEEGSITDATYTRISVGVNKDILWKGESVIEVKIRCDNDDRLFLTIIGSYPPNFEYPQVFQMLDDNLYCKSETANVENNIAIFSCPWTSNNSKAIVIGEQELRCEEYRKNLDIVNSNTEEIISLTNEFTPYTAEITGNFISWIEQSNYKLITGVPIVRVYDKEKNRINSCKTKYRVRNSLNYTWRNLNSSCVMPAGLVDILVEFPDGHTVIETFYAIGNLSFSSQNENIFSTEIICNCDTFLRPEIETIDNADITKTDSFTWKISRNKESNVCPSVCTFRIYNEGSPLLRLSISIPFDGIMITDVKGNIIPDGKIVSFSNLGFYNIISHRGHNRLVDVTYKSDRIDEQDKIKHLQSNVIDGLVSLADYSDLISRIFNLYGANSFDRSSSVVLNASGKQIYIRKFILESTIENGNILVQDNTQEDTENFVYQGNIYAFPVGEDITIEDLNTTKFNRLADDKNLFSIPDDFPFNEFVVFSGPEARRRIVPKYYNRNDVDFDKSERSSHSADVTRLWFGALASENIMERKHWSILTRAFDICSRNNLPFTTYNGLKVVARSPQLLANFILAMWLNECKDVLSQDIDRFEQEMEVALHWIPAKVWNDCIDNFIQAVPKGIQPMFYQKIQDFVSLLKDLFSSTVSTDIADEFSAYLVSGYIEIGKQFLTPDINNYKMKIHGISDLNHDLPLAKFNLIGSYYPPQSMLPSYKVMIESAMCAAENTCSIELCTDLFSRECKEQARVANFYRKYFKETYSEIFLRTIKILSNNKK